MSEAMMFDMDDTRKEKFRRVSGLIVDLLKAEMENPAEAYALLQFVREGMEECYGIKASLIYGKDKVAHT